MTSLTQPVFRKSSLTLIHVLLALLVVGICSFQLFLTYRGLDQMEAMDQAQIARNVAQGRGFTTQFLRPLDVMTASKQSSSEKETEPLNLDRFGDTNNAPLNVAAIAVALKLTGYDRFDETRLPTGETNVYGGDVVVSSVSTVFFLISLLLAYILAKRLFDNVIACTTVALMGLSELMLQYAASGLPQPLMMCFFLAALNFLLSSVRAAQNGAPRRALLYTVATFVAVSLMCLCGWIAIWAALGFLVFSGALMSPRGLHAVVGVLVMSVCVLIPLSFLTEEAGGMWAKFFEELHGCFGSGDAASIMRSSSLNNVPFNNSSFFLRLLGYTLAQFETQYINMGSIVVTPLFFLALFNRYKSNAVQSVKWAVFLVWVMSCIGLALFGQTRALGAAQLSILFAPLFTSYGLALLFNFLARLDLKSHYQAVRALVIFAVILISSGMFLFNLPKNLYMGIWTSDKGIPKFPPYYPPALNQDLVNKSNPSGVIMTDQPWAVAWYANRKALWIPKTVEEFDVDLEPAITRLGGHVQGILITPSSHSMTPGGMAGIIREYGDFAPLVMEGKLLQLAPKHNIAFADLFTEAKPEAVNAKPLGRLVSSKGRFSNRNFLLGAEIVYYSLPSSTTNGTTGKSL